MVTMGRAIKSQTAWNVSGLNTEVKLSVMCITRKRIMNRPVTLIMSFLPIDEEKSLAIVSFVVFFFKANAKLRLKL